jgi:predicted phosphoadenosine phosphosulfate sulfurtransferase
VNGNLENVLEAARRRTALVFDRFDRVVVSVSGGKDSHVVWHLAAAEAERRGRRVEAFFLDQEAEYAGTIDVIDAIMRHPATEPRWYQVPLRMTNATSHRDVFLDAWAPGDTWMRPRSPLAITEAPGAPDRFYDFFPWFEEQREDTAFIIGLRSRESLNRWRAVKNNPGLDGIAWSTTAKGRGNYRFSPIFDWNTGDVWKYLADEGLRYNRIYDAMYARGVPERQMRVSYLLHEQSFRAVTTLQELEPETYERLVRRIGGVHAAALYASEETYNARKLPGAFATWRAFREHLLATTPLDKIERFRKRFAKQGDDESTAREHCRQLLINDWENNVPMRRMAAAKLREAWWDRL